MDILQRIEKMSKAIEALSNDIKELKRVASENIRSAPHAGIGGHDAGDQLRAIMSYLALSPGMEEDELLNILLTCAMTVVKAEGAAVAIYDQKKKALFFRAAVGNSADRIIGLEVPVANSQIGIAFSTRQAIASTPKYRIIDEIVGAEFRNVLAAPLLIGNEAIGTLSAVNKRTEDHFGLQDLEDYSSFADLAAHIIQQRVRENTLVQMLEGDAAEIPKEFAELHIRQSDNKDLVELTRIISTIGRRSPEVLSVCKQLIEIVVNII